MSEKLTFGYGTSGHGDMPARGAAHAAPAAADTVPTLTVPPEQLTRAAKTDWAFVGLMMFTAVLYFRPQDMFRPLRVLHLAEISALFALGALAAGRLRRGLPVSRMTPELVGVFAFGAVILITAPFGVWMGGSIGTFTGLYAKVLLIFLLMINTLTSPKRVEQFTWLIVSASGYIASRAVFDYVSGVNLIENGRVKGSVGGMFQNPNDLALNMVAVLPLAAMLALRSLPMVQRLFAAICAVFMIGAIVATHSRSGTVGLAVMAVALAAHLVRRMPGLVFAGAIVCLLALPLLPASYWHRVASITDEKLDDTGSREARSILLRESLAAFAAHPLTGVGAGQFKNYNPEGREEAWRESHNSVLQVAAELGVFGLLVFAFLVARAIYAPMQTRLLLKAADPRRRRESRLSSMPPLSAAEHDMIAMHAVALSAALVGWFVCALFASVAYHWTFYYLLALAAAPRDYLQARLSAVRASRSLGSPPLVAPAGVHA